MRAPSPPASRLLLVGVVPTHRFQIMPPLDSLELPFHLMAGAEPAHATLPPLHLTRFTTPGLRLVVTAFSCCRVPLRAGNALCDDSPRSAATPPR